MLPIKFQLAFGFRRRSKKKIFKMAAIDGHHGGHLGFPISMILATFDPQVTLMRPTKFGVNRPFGSGEEERFLRWRPWRPSWISDGTILAIFDLQVTLMLPTKYRVNWPRGVGGVGF